MNLVAVLSSQVYPIAKYSRTSDEGHLLCTDPFRESPHYKAYCNASYFMFLASSGRYKTTKCLFPENMLMDSVPRHVLYYGTSNYIGKNENMIFIALNNIKIIEIHDNSLMNIFAYFTEMI